MFLRWFYKHGVVLCMFMCVSFIILVFMSYGINKYRYREKTRQEQSFKTSNTPTENIHNTLVTHGPLAGAVTDTSADVWVRINAPRTSRIYVLITTHAEDLDLKAKNAMVVPLKPISFVTERQSKWDYTWKGTILNLSPATTYYYTMQIDGQILPVTTYPNNTFPSFKTFVTPGKSVDFTVNFYSDFFWNYPFYNTFQYFKHQEQLPLSPAIVFLGGDLWHMDAMEFATNTEEFVNIQRFFFKKMYGNNSGVYSYFHNDILSHYPLIHIMDDHDMGVNNVDSTFIYKTQVLQILQEYFPTYALPASRNGFWQKFSYGHVDFFLLDVRSQRSPYTDSNTDPNKTMLGKEQLQWLKQSLLQSKATWKFIYSGVVFNSTLDKTDSWMGYPKERTELVGFLKGQSADNTTPVSGVIFVSGDAHGGAIDDGTNADFPEMLVPGPETQHCWSTAVVGSWSHGYYFSPFIRETKEDSRPPCPGFGIATIYTHPDRVDLTVKDDQGKTKLFYRHFLNQSDEKNYQNLPNDE